MNKQQLKQFRKEHGLNISPGRAFLYFIVACLVGYAIFNIVTYDFCQLWYSISCLPTSQESVEITRETTEEDGNWKTEVSIIQAKDGVDARQGSIITIDHYKERKWWQFWNHD